MLQSLPTTRAKIFATDRLGGSKDHRLDSHHPFPPPQNPPADPATPDQAAVRLRRSPFFGWSLLRGLLSSSQSIDPEGRSAGQFAHGAKTLKPFEQAGCSPAGQVAAGRGGRNRILIEQCLDHGHGGLWCAVSAPLPKAGRRVERSRRLTAGRPLCRQPVPNKAPPRMRVRRGGRGLALRGCGRAGPNRSDSRSGTGFGHLSFSAIKTSASAQARISASGREAQIAVTSSAAAKGAGRLD